MLAILPILDGMRERLPAFFMQVSAIDHYHEHVVGHGAAAHQEVQTEEVWTSCEYMIRLKRIYNF
jgi:hypothetical protein